jgi:putative protease
MPYELVVDGQTKSLGEIRYLLSPQDLAAVDLIPDLLAAGVRSFKIEGRLKSPEYVAAVTAVYRKAIDAALAGRPRAASQEDRYALEMTFSRGLSTGWLAGTNHPALTHGRFGKKRGALLGTIVRVGASWIELEQSHSIPLQAGDGVVFDAGEDRNHEQGGRIWKIEAGRIYFHRTFSPLDWARIRVGCTVWKTSDPRLDRELRKSWQHAKLMPLRESLQAEVFGSVGKKLHARYGSVGQRCCRADGLR